MAQKAAGKGMDTNKKVLIAGLLFIFLSIAWFAYEFLRPLTEDEIRQAKEAQKLQDDKDRKNATAKP